MKSTLWQTKYRGNLNVSLVDYTTNSPMINTTPFPLTPSSYSSYFWSASSFAPDPAYAWGVGFDYGGSGSGTLPAILMASIARARPA